MARKVVHTAWLAEDATVDPPGALGQRVRASTIAADAVTSLTTTGNTLSVWGCDSPDRFEDVALAFASTMKTVARMDLAFLPVDLLADFEIEDSLGDTPVEDLRPLHRDIAGLTLRTLGSFARSLAWTVRYGDIRKLAKEEVLRLLVRALDEGRLQLNDLHKDLKKELEDALVARAVLPIVAEVAKTHGVVAATEMKKNDNGKRQVELTTAAGERVAMVTLTDVTKRVVHVQPTVLMLPAHANQIQQEIETRWKAAN